MPISLSKAAAILDLTLEEVIALMVRGDISREDVRGRLCVNEDSVHKLRCEAIRYAIKKDRLCFYPRK